jgi:phosphatidylserine decarboxylase
MIRTKKGSVTKQPQSSLVQLGVQLQKIPILKDIIGHGVTEYCESIGNSEDTNNIQDFAETYSIDYRTIQKCRKCRSAEACWEKFENLNEFFARQRINLPNPVRDPKSRILSSPADSYAVFFPNETSQRFWIKGKKFSLTRLFLNDSEGLVRSRGEHLQTYGLYIFRLAPHHYHRFHAPVSGKILNVWQFGEKYYSVDRKLVQSVDVLTENKRIVLEIQTFNGSLVYMAIVGATCIGSIVLHVKAKDIITRNKEIGYFQYGGSTICVAFPLSTYSTRDTQLGSLISQNTLQKTETEIVVGDGLAVVTRPPR